MYMILACGSIFYGYWKSTFKRNFAKIFFYYLPPTIPFKMRKYYYKFTVNILTFKPIILKIHLFKKKN